jgi:TolB protein
MLQSGKNLSDSYIYLVNMDNNHRSTQVKTNYLWIILAIINLVLVLLIINNVLLNKTVTQANDLGSTSSPVATLTTSSSFSENPVLPNLSENMMSLDLPPSDIPLFIFSIYINQKSQLYAFHPAGVPFTRLIDEPYEEIHPSISHDNTKIAYSAKKNGYWDIYILNLNDGSEIRVTDSPEYDGSPSWSSDDLFITYESYTNGNLDIFIQDLQNLEGDPIQLTNGEEPQFSPSWSPDGREIAFVSTVDGDEEIWLAKLGAIEDRFVKVSDRPKQIDINPHWSPDGEKLLWTSENNGYPIIIQADFSNSSILVSEVAIGTSALLTTNLISYIQMEANQNFLISKNQFGNFVFPSIEIPGNVNGFTLLQNFEDKDFLVTGLEENPKLIKDAENFQQMASVKLVELEGVETEYPFLSSSVIQPFNEFRTSITNITGWDFLTQLDKTFIPITDPSTPGTTEEWLYTGRAFEFNPLSIHAGIITTIKEERSGQTYWRIFIKARYQDGSQGIPLKQMPFDLSARYNNDPVTYETGGMKKNIPEGYWIDLSELALSKSWERVPALANWQKYFNSARFNQFIYSNGLNWYAAMKELYPIEAFKSPTPIPTNPLTPTVSPTIRYYRSPTITSTPTVTIIPTRRPTWTPQP